MRLIRIGDPHEELPAVLVGDQTAIDVSPLVRDFDAVFFGSGGIATLATEMAAHDNDLKRIELRGRRVGAPIARPGNIIGIGLNYADHAGESQIPVPDEPVVFNKAPNTVIGPNDDVLIPRGSTKTDYEAELGVVMGRQCRYLDSPDTALEYVAGYCVSNDVSERAFQLERGGQWAKGKSSETFNPLGPWLVTADETGNPTDLRLGLELNGRTVQASSTRDMIFDVPYLVWYLSQFMVLEPGDLINTGTPSGVGMAQVPQRYLRPGDVMEAWVHGLGRQRSRLAAAFSPIPA